MLSEYLKSVTELCGFDDQYFSLLFLFFIFHSSSGGGQGLDASSALGR